MMERTSHCARGRLITLEGLDGAGKSSHVAWIAATLREYGLHVIETREPGGTPVGERIRQLLLTPEHQIDLDSEALLMFASRQLHLTQVIRPALARGTWVVCDRFTDSTLAFQGGGRGIDMARLHVLEAWVHGDLQPDLTLLFDVPVEVAQRRLQANANGADRIESEAAAFHERVRAAYLARVAGDTMQRFRVIDAALSFDAVRKQIERIFQEIQKLGWLNA